jgi:hypothetical protein
MILVLKQNIVTDFVVWRVLFFCDNFFSFFIFFIASLLEVVNDSNVIEESACNKKTKQNQLLFAID